MRLNPAALAAAAAALSTRQGAEIARWPLTPIRAFDQHLSQMYKNRVNAHANRSEYKPHQGQREIERRRKQLERDAKRAAKAGE